MAINILQLVEVIVEDATEVELDSAELLAGQSVEVPGHVQIGTVQGKAVYLYGILSTSGSYTPSSAPQPVAGNVSLVSPSPAASEEEHSST